MEVIMYINDYANQSIASFGGHLEAVALQAIHHANKPHFFVNQINPHPSTRLVLQLLTLILGAPF